MEELSLKSTADILVMSRATATVTLASGCGGGGSLSCYCRITTAAADAPSMEGHAVASPAIAQLPLGMGQRFRNLSS